MIRCTCAAEYWRHYEFGGQTYQPKYYVAGQKAVTGEELKRCLFCSRNLYPPQLSDPLLQALRLDSSRR